MKLKSILAISIIILVSVLFVACDKDSNTNSDTNIGASNFEETNSNDASDIIDTKAETTINAEPETVDTWELVQQAEAEYYSNLIDAIYIIEYSCADLETAGNLIKKVWHNSIWQINDTKTDKYTMENGVFFEDFNDALYKLEDDPDFIALCDKISSDQYEALELMRKLKEPPKKYADAYDSLKDFYNDYIKFTDLILYNSESYNSFTDKFEEYDASTYYLYQQMLIYFE